MRIEIAKIAQQEFNEAKAYYEVEQSGLGVIFEDEITKSLLRIEQFPYTWPFEWADIRRCLTHRFPYKILYSVQNEVILVLVFAHQHRKPDYWIDRIR